MEAKGAIDPKFDGLGHHHRAAPMGWARHISALKALFHLRNPVL